MPPERRLGSRRGADWLGSQGSLKDPVIRMQLKPSSVCWRYQPPACSSISAGSAVPWLMQAAAGVGRAVVVGQRHSAFAGGDDLDRVKAEDRDVGVVAAARPASR